ncbi:MAG: FAD binding domain-containing protein [Acidimicrobiales bacterium]
MSVSRYVAPETVEEILAVAREEEGNYAFMAGGTIVQPLLSAGSWLPHTVIGLWRAPLGTIERVNGNYAIGANVTMRDVALSALPGGLNDAARQVGGPAVRNRATVGGNIATGRGDLLVPLLALDAQVTLMSSSGTADTSIDDVLDEVTGEVSGLARGELITHILVPATSGRSAFVAIGRKAYNTPCVATACVVASFDPERPTIVANVRVAVHGPQPWPVRARSVEQVLVGRELDVAVLAEAETALCAVGDGFSDSVANAWYRSKMSGVALRRALEKVAGGQE